MLQGVDVQNDFEDYGLHNYGLAGTDNTEPLDWSTHEQLTFGAYVDMPLPVIDNEMLGLTMEITDDDIVAVTPQGRPLVRTKMIEMDPREVAFALRTGAPRPNAVGLADDGDIYQWTYTPVGGFFKKIWGAAKKVAGKVKGAVRKGARFVGAKAKALIKRLPGGKYLLKVYDRVKKIGMKLVGPLIKKIGPIAKRIAPLAAIVPGLGVGAAVALYKLGDFAQVVKKYKVMLDKAGKPKFKSGKQAKEVRDELTKRAKKAKKRLEAKRTKKKRAKRQKLKERIEAKVRREMAQGRPVQKQRLIAPPPAPRGTSGLGYNPYHYYDN